MSIRDRILNADDIRREIVDIPEWGVKIEVRAKTVEEQWNLLEKCRKPDGTLNSEILAVETIIATSYDPDTGEKIFEAADRDMLRKRSAEPFQKLLAAANRAAGLETEEQVVSDLDGTLDDAPSSD